MVVFFSVFHQRKLTWPGGVCGCVCVCVGGGGGEDPINYKGNSTLGFWTECNGCVFVFVFAQRKHRGLLQYIC